uniref:Uncharacterized protein n=1 Tax=Mycena chlorophos TaxID=658473 RepID=A0ABQ0M8P0_MYCCL|nr:predicted protein [Mycena chlorophos]
MTLLQLTAQSGELELIDLDDSLQTALHLAADGGYNGVLETLINAHATVICGSADSTTIQQMMQPGQLCVLLPASSTQLLAAHADLQTKNNRSETPLYNACEGGHTEVVKLFVRQQQVPINVAGIASTFAIDLHLIQIQEQRQRTPLYIACWGEHRGIVSALLEAKADINAATDRGQTALHAACYGPIDIMNMLIHSGRGNLEARDNDGYTPLHRACARNEIELVQALLDAGTNVNVRTTNGDLQFLGYVAERTALHVAAYWGYTEIAKILLKASIDAGILDARGKTALQVAEDEKENEMIELLLSQSSLTA